MIQLPAFIITKNTLFVNIFLPIKAEEGLRPLSTARKSFRMGYINMAFRDSPFSRCLSIRPRDPSDQITNCWDHLRFGKLWICPCHPYYCLNIFRTECPAGKRPDSIIHRLVFHLPFKSIVTQSFFGVRPTTFPKISWFERWGNRESILWSLPWLLVLEADAIFPHRTRAAAPAQTALRYYTILSLYLFMICKLYQILIDSITSLLCFGYITHSK